MVQAQVRRPFRRLPAANDGGTSVEFAIVGSTFVLLVVFLFSAGLLLWARGALQMAASQTARCTAIASSACPDPKAYANDLLSAWGVAGIIPPATISVSVQPNVTCSRTSGLFSKVTISGTNADLAWAVAPLSSTVLTATACYPSSK